ncbi:MAG: hypothetical protein QW547_00120 [Candidatus Bathyarchaeia archaeon]
MVIGRGLTLRCKIFKFNRRFYPPFRDREIDVLEDLRRNDLKKNPTTTTIQILTFLFYLISLLM